MIELKLLYFGEVEDLVHKSDETIRLNTPALASLKAALQESYHLDITEFNLALNNELIVDTAQDIELKHNDTVAIMSQFAGG